MTHDEKIAGFLLLWFGIFLLGFYIGYWACNIDTKNGRNPFLKHKNKL